VEAGESCLALSSSNLGNFGCRRLTVFRRRNANCVPSCMGQKVSAWHYRCCCTPRELTLIPSPPLSPMHQGQVREIVPRHLRPARRIGHLSRRDHPRRRARRRVGQYPRTGQVERVGCDGGGGGGAIVRRGCDLFGGIDSCSRNDNGGRTCRAGCAAASCSCSARGLDGSEQQLRAPDHPVPYSQSGTSTRVLLACPRAATSRDLTASHRQTGLATARSRTAHEGAAHQG
jgi:hypothetical protein